MSLYLDKMKLSWGRRGGRISGERTRSHANIWVPIKVYQDGLYWLGDSLKLLGVCCKGFVQASFFSCQRGIRRSTIAIALSGSLLLFESSPPNRETRPGSYRCLETPDDLSPGLKEGTSPDQVVGHWFCDARSSCLLSRDARRINLAPRRVDMRSVQNQGEEREGGGRDKRSQKSRLTARVQITMFQYIRCAWDAHVASWRISCGCICAGGNFLRTHIWIS